MSEQDMGLSSKPQSSKEPQYPDIGGKNPRSIVLVFFALAMAIGIFIYIIYFEQQPDSKTPQHGLFLGTTVTEEQGKHTILKETVGVELNNGDFLALVKAGTSLPSKSNFRYTSLEDMQTWIPFHILSGNDAKALRNKSLGRLRAIGFKPGPAYQPSVDISIQVDKDGRIMVSAWDVIAEGPIFVEPDLDNPAWETLANGKGLDMGLKIGALRYSHLPGSKHKILQESLGLNIGNDAFAPLVVKGMILPARAVNRITNAEDDQQSLVFDLAHGVSDKASENTSYGKIETGDFERGDAGTALVEFTIEVDSDAQVTVWFKDLKADSKFLPITLSPLKQE